MNKCIRNIYKIDKKKKIKYKYQFDSSGSSKRRQTEWAVMWFARMTLPTFGWEEKTVQYVVSICLCQREQTLEILR